MKQSSSTYKGNDRILVGFILGLLSFWLFGMTLLNISSEMNQDLGLSKSTLTTAISVTSLIAGIFVVFLGGLADKYGRVRMTHLGFVLGAIGSLLIALTPSHSSLSGIVLILGRVLQGFSGALIMPATLALIKTYWDNKSRPRAVSLWGMGTWGGSSFASLFGGLMIGFVSWRVIFYLSALICLIGLYLCKDIPESRVTTKRTGKFDALGFVSFMIGIATLLIYVNYGTEIGWGSLSGIVMAGLSVVSLVIFYLTELKVANPFVDFSIFKNKTFTGATISNFILNSTSGIIIVVLSLLQEAGGKSATEAGYLTIGYGLAIVLFIRLGEKLLQKMGPRKPMLIGSSVLLLTAILLCFTNTLTGHYMTLMGVAFALFGLGLAIYATPSTDAALSNLPADMSGKGTGIYKMASSLGAGFGIALSTAIYRGLKRGDDTLAVFDQLFVYQGDYDNILIRQSATVTMLFNILLIVVAILSIYFTIPKESNSNDR